jgi:hypothetical protein
MKVKFFLLGVMLAVACVAASAQVPGQLRLRGLLNDYTPSTTGGPWEMHGEWSLHVLKQVDGQPQRAIFSAEVNMERSDEGVMLNGDDFTMPTDRHAHTHHISVDGQVVKNLLDKNNNVIGFEVTGVATITGNGNPPPDFDPLAEVTIDVTGGTLVKYSNLKLTFGASPSNPPAHNASAVDHFGPYPLNGVVKSTE